MPRFVSWVTALFVPSAWDIWTWGSVYAPAFLSVAVFVSAILEGLPITWVLTATALAFGGGASGILRLSEWRSRNSVATKLRFADVGFALNGNWDNDGLRLDKIQCSLVLESIAHFPIQFRITKFKSTFANRTHDGRGPTTEGTVLAGRVPRLGGQTIEINPPLVIPRRERWEGTIEFEIKYGRRVLNQTIRHTLKTFVFMPDNRPPETNWSYADEQADEQPSD